MKNSWIENLNRAFLLHVGQDRQKMILQLNATISEILFFSKK
jgi:hypothetical protein